MAQEVQRWRTKRHKPNHICDHQFALFEDVPLIQSGLRVVEVAVAAVATVLEGLS